MVYGAYRRVCGTVSTEELVRFTLKTLRATEKGEVFGREEDVLWFARAAAAELERRHLVGLRVHLEEQIEPL